MGEEVRRVGKMGYEDDVSEALLVHVSGVCHTPSTIYHLPSTIQACMRRMPRSIPIEHRLRRVEDAYLPKTSRKRREPEG